MSDKRTVEDGSSGEPSNQNESFEDDKSSPPETYDMKDFCPGIRIEAKDFDGKWYPAKVSDVDWTENEILVHFENWNTKFDEWIPMDSSRLRPLQKPPLQQKDHIKFSKGEEVMAMWSPYQKYPATIQAVLANDRYDVLFYDGFLKRLKSHKISKLEGGVVKNEVRNFTDIGTKEERRERKRKINVAELFHINKRSKKKGLVHSKSQDIKTYPVTKPKNKSSFVKKMLPDERNKEKIPETDNNEMKVKDNKLCPSGTVMSAKALVDTIPAAFEVKYINGQTEMWSKQLYQRSEGRTAGKLDIVILNPQGRKFRSRNEIMKYCEENGIVYSHEAFDFSAKGRPKSKPPVLTPKLVQKSEDKEKPYLKKGGKKLFTETEPSSQSFPQISQPKVLLPESLENKVFIGDLEVVIENGKFICPVKICGKHFRRENLLHMHMKHYHPEFSKYLDYTPSVTDLAYARTVGGLDSGEVNSPVPRKLLVAEKLERPNVKGENVRKASDVSPDLKETKKIKTNEIRQESKANAGKVLSSSPTPSSEPVEGLVEDIQNNKLTSRNLMLKSTSVWNESASIDEITGNDSENQTIDISIESQSPVSQIDSIKPLKHGRIHSRKKCNRFQSSFAEHMRKKRLESQDRNRSHNKGSRQQQPQNLKQQLQQTPQTTMPTHSYSEDTNSNAPCQGLGFSRYPKPQSNITNETSGKNNLFNSSKALSPVPKIINRAGKDSYESFENMKKCNGNPSENLVIFNEMEERENALVSKKEKYEGKSNKEYDRRSFLTGLLNARKRKAKGAGYTRKKKKKRFGNRFQSLKLNGELKMNSGLDEEKGNMDDVGVAKYGFNSKPESISVNKKEDQVSLDSNSLLEEEKNEFTTEKLQKSNQLKNVKIRIKRLDGNQLKAVYGDSQVEKNTFSEVSSIDSSLSVERLSDEAYENGTFLPVQNSDSSELETVKTEEEESSTENVFRSYHNNFDDKTKTKNVVEPANYKLEKEWLKSRENVGCSQQKKVKVFKKGKRKGKVGNSKENRQNSKKRVRFENTVMEKWINFDEDNEFNRKFNENQRGITNREARRREAKRKKKRLAKGQLVNYLNQKEVNQVKQDNSAGESLPHVNSGLDQAEGADTKAGIVVDNDKVEKLRRNEIINCVCGITEEDGLMIQCDICLCWQHGHCAGILRELDVPDKYTCAICKNPYRGRSSMKYLHDQEWLKEGSLPSLSFRSKREEIINQRKTVLKRSFDLSGSIVLLGKVIHSLRVKVNIAEKKDHPKLWLWAKKWLEKKPNRLKEDYESKDEKIGEQSLNLGVTVKKEESLPEDEKYLPKAPEPEAPIDSSECRLNLLDHLIHYQSLVDARLSCIESVVAELESMQDDAVNDEAPDRYPRTKATVQMILRDLKTMEKIASI